MMRRLLGGIVAIVVIALAVSLYRFSVSRGEPISGEMRTDFVRSAVEGCVTRQKASPDNADVAPETITAYCECYADALATRVMTIDIERLRGATAADMQDSMRAKMADSEDVCLAKLDKKT